MVTLVTMVTMIDMVAVAALEMVPALVAMIEVSPAAALAGELASSVSVVLLPLVLIQPSSFESSAPQPT